MSNGPKGKITPAWLRSDEAYVYVVDCYQGAQMHPEKPSIMRRVFQWMEDGVVKQGNTDAFLRHLGRKFNREYKLSTASEIHKLLRDLGEVVIHTRSRQERKADGPNAGNFRQPLPQEWQVGTATSLVKEPKGTH